MLNRLGDYIELNEEKNTDLKYGESDVKGISINKIFIETKANLKNVSLRPYLVVRPKHFAYVTVTSRNGEKVSMAFNDTEETYIVSSSYVSFSVKDQNQLLPEYLYIFFNRPEFDRISRFHSWGSARETFSFEDLCDLKIEVPSIEIQQKYVDVYNALVANQKAYENGLDDLKFVCDAYIENLRKKIPSVEIGDYLIEVTEKNIHKRYTVNQVMGVSKNKEIIPTKADSSGNDLSKFTVIEENDFVYNPRSADAIAIYTRSSKCIISWNNTAFRIKPSHINILLPKYLNLWFSRAEYSRWAKFNSWGSSTELLSMDEIKKYRIPIPSINIQKRVVEVFDAYEKRKKINEKLKDTINNLCPILIKGSINSIN
ncbi:MAG TPA: restriction endonuclease subunit S [Gallicola sp.]|nr:restriction endonuclease subunit S [Gallicola sp.]